MAATKLSYDITRLMLHSHCWISALLETAILTTDEVNETTILIDDER